MVNMLMPHSQLDSQVMIDNDAAQQHLRGVGCTFGRAFTDFRKISRLNSVTFRDNEFETIRCAIQGCTKCTDVSDVHETDDFLVTRALARLKSTFRVQPLGDFRRIEAFESLLLLCSNCSRLSVRHVVEANRETDASSAKTSARM